MGFNTDILDDKNITAYAKLIYFTLSKFINREGQCWPAQKTLQQLTGLSKNTVFRALKDLEKAKHIVAEHRFINGLKTSSLYILPNLVKSDTPEMTIDTPDRELRYPSQGITDGHHRGINLSILTSPNNIKEDEKDVLNYLPQISGYPFDEYKDLQQCREWLKSYPANHVLGELEKFNAWWRDNGDKIKKPNYRSRITNWLKKSKVEYRPSVKSNRLDRD